MYGPSALAVDQAGNLFIADTSPFFASLSGEIGNNSLIREVSNGVITTVAGSLKNFLSVCNDPALAATSVHLSMAGGTATDAAGNLYLADSGNNCVRKLSNGLITTVAASYMLGFGGPGFSGDDGPAISAKLNYPTGVAVDASTNVYIADSGNARVRRISGGVISTIAGNGTHGFTGDGGPATSA